MRVLVLEAVDEVLEDVVDGVYLFELLGEEAGRFQQVLVQVVHVEVELELFREMLSQREDLLLVFPGELLEVPALSFDYEFEDIGGCPLSGGPESNQVLRVMGSNQSLNEQIDNV